jgi:hypothetical protein
METAPMDETSPQNRYQEAVRESILKAAKRNSAYMLMNTLTTVIPVTDCLLIVQPL